MKAAADKSSLPARHTAATAGACSPDLVQVTHAALRSGVRCHVTESESWVLVGTGVPRAGGSDGSQLKEQRLLKTAPRRGPGSPLTAF